MIERIVAWIARYTRRMNSYCWRTGDFYRHLNRITMNTIIEKIRAEIERRMRICERVRGEGGENQDYYHGKAVSYNETLTFLSDLEKELLKDFPTTDKEMKQFLATHPKAELPEKYKTPDWMFDGLTPEEKMNHPLYLEGFEVGRKVGLVLAEKTTIPAEGLEEEIYNYANTIAEGTPLFEIIPQTARHFVQWQKEQDNVISQQAEAARIKTQQMCYEKGQADMKEQMMKEAVEKKGVVWDDEFVKFDDGTFLDFRDPTLGITPAFVLPKNGEKVRVIVIKEN